MVSVKLTGLCLLLVLCIAMSVSASAESLAGEWKGTMKVSLLPFAVSANVKFDDYGGFRISITGLTATGQYRADGATITVRPETFDGMLAGLLMPARDVGDASLSYAIADGELTMAGNLAGVEGALNATRK